VREDAAFRSDLDPVCTGNSAFGLGGGIGTVTARTLRVRRSRLLRRRAFTVTGPTQRADRCERSSFYSHCTENSTIRVRLRFTPARGRP
jgi:hypothetical protein